MDHPAGDQASGFLAVAEHVRGGRVRLKAIAIFPFLDDDKRLWPELRLEFQDRRGIDGRLVLDAATLGEDIGHIGLEQFQNGRALSGLCRDDGNDMNHARDVERSREKLQPFRQIEEARKAGVLRRQSKYRS